MWILIGESEITKFDGVYRNCKYINFVTTGGTISMELKSEKIAIVIYDEIEDTLIETKEGYNAMISKSVIRERESELENVYKLSQA